MPNKTFKTNFKFSFNIVNLEDKKDKERFIIEGYAASNDVDFHNDIIADEAIKKASKGMIGKPVYFQHDVTTPVGKCIEAKFQDGKLWVKDEIYDEQLKKHISKGKLYNLSIGGRITKVELVYLPELDTKLKVIKGLCFDEHSVVFLGAQSEAKTIRWYTVKSMELEKELVELEEVKKEDTEDTSEEVEAEEVEGKETESVEGEETEETANNDKKEDEKSNEENDKSDEEVDEKGKDADLSDKKETEDCETIEMTKEEYVAKPFPNEHSCRFEDPAGFDKFARKNCYKKHDGKCVDYIFGIKENKSKVQAMRFSKKIWKASEASAYCKPKGGSFEAASESKKSVVELLEKAVADKNFDLVQKALDTYKKEKVSVSFHKNTIRELSDTVEDRPIYQVYRPGEIQLMDVQGEKSDVKKFKKEILRVGKWYHSAAENGILRITKKALENIVKNFKDKVIQHVSTPLGHTSDVKKNAGEVVGLEISKSGRKLYAEMAVKDDDTAELIQKDLIKGVSASIDQNYLQKTDGTHVGPTLLHVAFVSEPYVKNLGNFVPLSEEFEGRENIHVFEDKENIELQDLIEQVEDMKSKLEKDSSVEEKTEESTESEEKVEGTEETEAEVELADKGVESAKVAWEEFLRQGKVVPAQKNAFLALFKSKGKIMLSEDEVDVSKALLEFLGKQPSVISFEEEGTSAPDEKKEKEEEKSMPDSANKFFDDIGLSEDARDDAWKEFEKLKGEDTDTTTPL